MTEDSERIPVGDDYLHALGRAIYNFAYLEWGIVWLTETIEPGFISDTPKLTASEIARRFSSAVEQLANSVQDKEQIRAVAASFAELIPDRNSMVHGDPYTAMGGEQRLLYDGRHGHKDWTIVEMRKFASSAAHVSQEANRLLHNGRLQQYQGSRS